MFTLARSTLLRSGTHSFAAARSSSLLPSPPLPHSASSAAASAAVPRRVFASGNHSSNASAGAVVDANQQKIDRWLKDMKQMVESKSAAWKEEEQLTQGPLVRLLAMLNNRNIVWVVSNSANTCIRLLNAYVPLTSSSSSFSYFSC